MVKKVSGSSDRGKIKVRFFEIEMDGDTEALQESLRTLTSAINKPVSQGQRHFLGGMATPKQIAPTPEALEGEVLEDDEEESLENELQGSTAPVGSKPGRQRAKRTPPTPKILDDLGFDEGDPTWSAFSSSKTPDNDVLRSAVAATWFKRVKGIDAITIDHAYTAYKFVDWPTPDDIGQSFRNAKRLKNWFGTDGSGNWTINIIGINAVDKLKKSEGTGA